MIKIKIKKVNLSKFFILLVLFGCSKSQTYIENDLTKRELTGNVKSVDVFYYKVYEKSNNIIKREGGKIDYFSFNNHGDLVESKSFHGNEYKEITDLAKLNNVGNSLEADKDKGHNLRLKCVFSYNKKNKLKEQIRYNSKGDETCRILYEYGVGDERIKVTDYRPNGTISGETNNKYNDNFKLIESIGYGQKYTFEYDRKGNRIQSNYITAKQKYIYKYNSSNKILEATKYDLNNTILFEEAYYYNRKGFLIKKVNTSPKGDNYEYHYTYNDNDNLVEKSTVFSWRKPSKYIFEYDKNGNWIKKYKYENSECLYLWERKINYYN